MASVNDWMAQSRATMEASNNAALGNYKPTSTVTNIDYSKSDPTKGAAGIVAQTSTSTPATSVAASTAARAAQMQQQYSAKQAQQAASTPANTSATGSIVAQKSNAASAAPATTTAANTTAPAATTPAAAVPTVAAPMVATPAASTPTVTPAPATAAPVNSSSTSRSGSETVSRTVPVEYTPTGMYVQENLDRYNADREAQIRALYAAAQQNTLNGLRTAYDQNMSDASAARDLISPQYQERMNALSSEYERQRRNNNMQAAVNGLNTGAGSQMALAQSAAYQANQGNLARSENEALNEANRRIQDLQRNYQNAVAEATASNNYKLAAALMDEYQNAYNRQMNLENTNYQRSLQNEQQNYTRTWNENERDYSRGMDEAAQKAQYGDFSGFKDVYGDEVAKGMEAAWALQNPQQAWASGKISSADYYALTGRMPNDPNSVASQLPGGGGTYGGVTPTAASSGTGSSGGYFSGSGYGSLSGLDPTMGSSWRDYLESNNAPSEASGQSTGGSSGSRSYSRSYSSGRASSGSRSANTGFTGYYDKYGNFVNETTGTITGSAINNPGAGQRVSDTNQYVGTPSNAGAMSSRSISSTPAANNTSNTFEQATQAANQSTNPLSKLPIVGGLFK